MGAACGSKEQDPFAINFEPNQDDEMPKKKSVCKAPSITEDQRSILVKHATEMMETEMEDDDDEASPKPNKNAPVATHTAMSGNSWGEKGGRTFTPDDPVDEDDPVYAVACKVCM
jgi:hypothetical protein